MFTVVLFFFCAVSSWGGWHDSKVVVVGKFGSTDGDFGLQKEYIEVLLPNFKIEPEDNKIIIADIVNKRIKVYSKNGVLISKFGPKISYEIEETWPGNLLGVYDGKISAEWGRVFQTYQYDGNLISSFEKDNTRVEKMLAKGEVILFNLNEEIDKYQKYSSTGELLATYDEKPLELGVIKSYGSLSEIGGEGVQYTIAYEDTEFTITTPIAIDRDTYMRDQAGFLYVTGQPETPDSDWPWRYRVFKFDACGKLLATLDMPETKTEVIELGAPQYVGYSKTIFLEEYGPPVIGPDGSVYAWKRTPETYSILKWTWVDSPDDSQPGPDAPANLTVQPSIDGLYLTWGASPQDPGCVDGYEVERSKGAGGIYTSVKTTDPGVLKFNDTDALPGSTYFYKVRAKSGSSYSPYTAEMSGTR